MIKRVLIYTALFMMCFLSFGQVAFAQTSEAVRLVAPIPIDYQINIPGINNEDQVVYGPIGGCPIDHVCVRTIESYINAVYKWGTSAGVIFAIAIVMIGGIEYMVGSAAGTIENAKKRIKNGVSGLLILLSITAILSLVNPEITQLKALELPAVATIFVQSENTEADNEDIDPGDPDSPDLPPVISSGTPQQIIPIATGSSVLTPNVRPTTQLLVSSIATVPDVPYFNQRNYNDSYGGCSTIKTSGCGPTAAAMVLSYNNVNVEPTTVANTFAGEGYRACARNSQNELDCNTCQGTSWSAFTSSSIIRNNNLIGRKIEAINRSEILELLAAGRPLIASVGCSRFTKAGHFIVLRGLNADGTIAINDPNSTTRKHTTASELWDEVYISPGGTRNCTQGQNRPPLKAVWLIEPANSSDLLGKEGHQTWLARHFNKGQLVVKSTINTMFAKSL